MKKIPSCIVFASVAFLFATILTTGAFAQDVAASGMATRAVHRAERRLGLTEAQRAQARLVLQQEAPKIEQLHKALVEERTAMIAANANGFDSTAAQAVAAKYAQANADAVVEHAKVRYELVALLTPAQQQRLAQLRARFGAAFDARLETLGATL